MNEQNLKPYAKGTSGNPGGRPPGSKNVTTQMLKLLKRTAPDTIIDTDIVKSLCGHLKRPSNADAIAAQLVYGGLNGDMQAIKEINNRAEGRAPLALTLGGLEGSPLEVIYSVVYEDEPTNGHTNTN
jgi:hypothetical protein